MHTSISHFLVAPSLLSLFIIRANSFSVVDAESFQLIIYLFCGVNHTHYFFIVSFFRTSHLFIAAFHIENGFFKVLSLIQRVAHLSLNIFVTEDTSVFYQPLSHLNEGN